MATQIIWDEEPTDVTSPEPPQKLEPSTTSPTMLSPEAYRAMYLGTVDIHELITELNKRGYVVHDSRGLYTPTTVTTSPYAPTITTTSWAYAIPTTTTTVTSALGSIGASSLGNTFTWK